MAIIGLVPFVGVVVFGVLFAIMVLKGGSLKIPTIGMAVCFVLTAAIGALIFLEIGPFGDGTADDGSEPSKEVESQDVDESEAVESEKGEEPSQEPTQGVENIETPNLPPSTSIEPVSTAPGTETLGQKNALTKAKQYLSTMAFSYSGLVNQLEYEGYTTDEATYGVENCGADWNEQAAKKAQQYLDTMAFSRQGLIDQLLYEGFTQTQAEYGVTAVGY